MPNVLLVEDNHLFRDWAKFVMERHGLVVFAYRTAEEALEQIASEAVAIDLMLTDIRLPKINGWDLFQAVLGLQPKLQVLFMSVDSLEFLRRQQMDIPADRFLRKPFECAALLQKLDLLIHAPH